MNIRNKKKKSGQAMVEYIIIVVLVAIACIVVVGAFGDRLRAMFDGATGELGGQGGSDGTSSVEMMQELGN
jgi:Flp pilus assembly pilin Flp